MWRCSSIMVSTWQDSSELERLQSKLPSSYRFRQFTNRAAPPPTPTHSVIIINLFRSVNFWWPSSHAIMSLKNDKLFLLLSDRQLWIWGWRKCKLMLQTDRQTDCPRHPNGRCWVRFQQVALISIQCSRNSLHGTGTWHILHDPHGLFPFGSSECRWFRLEDGGIWGSPQHPIQHPIQCS